MTKKSTKRTEAANTCAQCGKTLKPQARFCSECGAPVGTTESSKPESLRSVSGKTTGSAGLDLGSKLEEMTKSGIPGLATLPQSGAAMPGVTSTAQPIPPTRDRTSDRIDRVTVVAKWYGALRQLYTDKNPDSFAGTIREILDMIAPYSDARDQFENFMFINLLSMTQNQSVLPAAQAALYPFPDRFQQYVDDPNRLSSLDLDGGPWTEIIESWPYGTFYVTYEIADEELAEICIQTIYELGILNLAPNGYLEDEEARIEGGLYPNSIKPIIQRAYAKCHSVDTKEWGNSVEQRADTFVKLYAPFGHPGNYRKMQGTFAQLGGPPAPPENLADWELEQIHAFVKDQSYNRQEVLNMLINRWESLSTQLSRMDFLFQSIFVFQQHLLTLCLNMNSRRINPLGHKDYGSYASPGSDFEGTIRQSCEENMPFLIRGLWPTVQSLFSIEYSMKQQRRT